MAIINIHPIYGTLKKAINYIVDPYKTDSQYVSAFLCTSENASKQFLNVRNEFKKNTKVLARHLIQSFKPGEVSPEEAHELGKILCKKILNKNNEQYQYIIATHLDKEHIHNHIIFNNINLVNGKCYKSNKKTYYQLRYESDKICKEYNISVIEKYYGKYVRKYKNKSLSYYDYLKEKKGITWKSKLQTDIDKMIKKVKNFEEFLNGMQAIDYEIKQGKHIAFRYKNKKRFTRSKVIGEDYTKKRIIERIQNKEKEIKNNINKNQNYIIDMDNEKVKNSSAYTHFAKIHNLKSISNTILEMSKLDIKNKNELSKKIEEKNMENKFVKEEIKKLEVKEMEIKNVLESIYVIKTHQDIYDYYIKSNDDLFYKNNQKEIEKYIKALAFFKEKETKNVDEIDIKILYNEIENIENKKIIMFEKSYSLDNEIKELKNIQKNYDMYFKENVKKENKKHKGIEL